MARKSQREAAVPQLPPDQVSTRRAETLKRTADKGLTPKDLKRVIAHLQGLLVEMRAKTDKVFDRKAEVNVTPEQASEIMGKGNFFGPEAVKNAFGIELAADHIPRIPFSKAELKKGKALGQMLVLRVNKAQDGAPLTMQKMNETVGSELTRGGKGHLLYNTNWYQREKFFTQQTPTFGWALVSKKVLQDSTSKNDIEQTEILALEVREVFEGMPVPKNIQKALRQFKAWKEEIEGFLKTNWKEAARRLSTLDINKLFRRSPAEIIYDLVMVLKNSDQRLLSDRYEKTNCLSSNGMLVDLGEFDDDGVYVSCWAPYDSDPKVGVSFSRSH